MGLGVKSSKAGFDGAAKSFGAKRFIKFKKQFGIKIKRVRLKEQPDKAFHSFIR
jgi:hypothetical protein